MDFFFNKYIAIIYLLGVFLLVAPSFINSNSNIDRLKSGSALSQWMGEWDTDPTDKASLFRNEYGDLIRITDLVRDAGLSEVRQLKELFLYLKKKNSQQPLSP